MSPYLCLGGYVNCLCRDCMEVAIERIDGEGAFCHECVEAGCPDYQGIPGLPQECCVEWSGHDYPDPDDVGAK